MLTHRRLLAGGLALTAVVLGLQAARPSPPATAALIVARHDLPAGAVLSAADLTSVAVPPDAIPAGTVRRAAGRILATPLHRGEPLTDLRLVGPALTQGHPDLVAVPIRLPDAGMAALLRVGDRIRLLATDPQGSDAPVAVTTVAEDALVLALPAADDGTAAKTSSTGVTSALGGRLVVVGVIESEVDRVTSAAVRDFLTYAYPH